MKYSNISKCCGAKAWVRGDVTHYYECAACGEACDVDRKKIDLNKIVELIRKS